MKTEARLELLQILDEMSETAPDFRLGQLLAMFLSNTRYEYEPAAGLYSIDDEELLAAARGYRDNYRGLTHRPVESTTTATPFGCESAARVVV